MTIKKKNAFTIVELLVAMTLLVILVALSSVVFSSSVKAYRKAVATIEITHHLNTITTQLNQDFRGLRRDGEIFLVWVAKPERDENNAIIDEDGNGIPDHYLKYDRILFFADGNFQTYRPQATTTPGVTKQVTGNLARICYMPANTEDTQAEFVTPCQRRILARVQHIVTADGDLPLFPDPADLIPANWDPAAFEADNSNYEYQYQTMTMTDWTNMSDPTSPYFAAKNNILTILTDVSNVLAVDNTVTEGGPVVETGIPDTYHNLFCEGVCDFGIQIWRADQQRWFPQIDPNGDGDYTDTDYFLDDKGTAIHETKVDGFLYEGDGEANLITASGVPLKFTALKFTFRLKDSKNIFPDGKVFTHIVYLDD